MDILEQMETIINRTKHATHGYTHSQIFEILTRKMKDLKYDLMVAEYNKRLEAAGIKQDQPTV